MKIIEKLIDILNTSLPDYTKNISTEMPKFNTSGS